LKPQLIKVERIIKLFLKVFVTDVWMCSQCL